MQKSLKHRTSIFEARDVPSGLHLQLSIYIRRWSDRTQRVLFHKPNGYLTRNSVTTMYSKHGSVGWAHPPASTTKTNGREFDVKFHMQMCHASPRVHVYMVATCNCIKAEVNLKGNLREIFHYMKYPPCCTKVENKLLFYLVLD